MNSIEYLIKQYKADGDTKHLNKLLMIYGLIHKDFVEPLLHKHISMTDGFIDVVDLVALPTELVKRRDYYGKRV